MYEMKHQNRYAHKYANASDMSNIHSLLGDPQILQSLKGTDIKTLESLIAQGKNSSDMVRLQAKSYLDTLSSKATPHQTKNIWALGASGLPD